MSNLETIIEMLSYRRPAGSATEAEFIGRFILPLGASRDPFGNHLVQIGEAPSILWSSHTDSVHTTDGRQHPLFDGTFVHMSKRSKSNCLGSDDAAGVWIMTEMIKAQVPGLYVFHFAEEIGCVGSRAIATSRRHILSGVQAAVAFDRRGNNSVITHQGSRCCSDAFGDSLKAQLPDRYRLDPTGVATDTKMYMSIVPECSNLSVGYYSEHRPDEKLDAHHLFELRDHMVRIDASRFVIERDPTSKPVLSISDLIRNIRSRPQIDDLIEEYPHEVAEFIRTRGFTYSAVKAFIDGMEIFERELEDEDDDRLTA